MFLKRERPETDDFAIKKYQVVNEKYFQYFKKCEICVLGDTLTKIFQKCLCIFLRFRTFIVFLICFLQKGLPPPHNRHVH